ncbi:MAG: hypothetical protein WC725_01900 [Patescibacteria group bacterium]|jgi:hypothetical protein
MTDEKIFEQRAVKRMKDEGLDPEVEWQKYYKYLEEEKTKLFTDLKTTEDLQKKDEQIKAASDAEYFANQNEETIQNKNAVASALSLNKLIIPEKSKSYIIFVECKRCGQVKKPYKWEARWIFGIAFLFTILNIFGLLIFFVSTNPYICPACLERNKLVKILNDGKKIPISSLSKNQFVVVATIFLIIGVIIKFRNYLSLIF